MAKHKISVPLTQHGIRQLQSELDKYMDDIKYKARELAEKLSERGVEIARVRIADLDAIFTGDLLSSIHSEYKGSQTGGAIFAVVSDSMHAVYGCRNRPCFICRVRYRTARS